ncbi:Pentatricopeptide repeat-containing [Hyphodiscus hymeniophilus]|uniref:Pentatricopeptide repeat-containing n=1 Tax=Hyphodiscus hymeniophilus TaxID=353542 RepID=A0A9P7B039_9HELO|nr:Pentatricopeptide repeat-containing [Hyphodiscus hymeniophilus]
MGSQQKQVAIGRDSLRKGWRRPNSLLLRSPEPPTKLVSLSPGHTSSYVLSWQTRFAALCSRRKGDHKLLTFTNCGAEPDLLESLIGTESSTSLYTAWQALPDEIRRDIWPELMLTALDKYPTKALKVLAATYTESWPPGYAVSDSFDYIILHYLGDRTSKHSKNALDIFGALDQMLRKGPLGHFQLSQKSVWLLLKNLDHGFVGSLFQILKAADHPLTKHTLMHFPSQLRLSNGPDERIDILRRLRQAGSDFNSVEVLSVCATLLQRKNRSSEVFELMLDCGMKPNIIIYNVLLQNSVEAGDPETAWQIHDMMIENGIETDAYTYSLLLMDGKLRGDRSSIKRILNIVGERGMRNAHIATDILHTIYISRQEHNLSPRREAKPAKLFERMLKTYQQYFRLEPLTRLVPWLDLMCPTYASSLKCNDSDLLLPSKDSLMVPEVPTLVVMLTALMKECSEPVLIVRLYNDFHDLVIAGDPTATALAKSTHLYNIILMALGRFQETLVLCPRLIGDMLSPHVAERTSVTIDSQSTVEEQPTSEPSSNPQRLHPKPDVYTWSILLKVFMDHGQPRAAEKVLSMMEERKVWPNQVTWNSLIVGYARMQDMSMTVNAVDRLRRSGFQLDGVSMKGLSYFQNRRALIEALKASEAHDPGRSRRKRPAAISKAVSALNKAFRMVNEGADVGLHRWEEATDNNYDVASSEIKQGGPSVEFVIGDIPREADKDRESVG